MKYSPDITDMTATIVASYLSKNVVDADKIPNIIHSVHQSLLKITNSGQDKKPRPEPAVPISKSITPDYVICLEDGKKLKMLKRYLRSRYNMTPDEYRSRWNLPHDYPMVAPNYTKLRSDYAKEIGLGKKKPED